MLVGVDDKPGVVAQIFGALADRERRVDMIIQNAPRHALGTFASAPEPKTDVTFTVAKTDLAAHAS
jgi:aspartate kinase